MEVREARERLAALLDNMAKERRTVTFFFRDDDVGKWDEPLAHLVDLFLTRQAPLNLAIIPARIDSASARHLMALKNRWPELLCYSQHGYRHANYAAVGKKSEFPPGRSLEEQLSDVKAGMEVLRAALREAFFPAFTPPWNRCSPTTLDALAILGFRVISCDTPLVGAIQRGLMEMPVTLDILHRTTDGRWLGREHRGIVGELSEQVKQLMSPGIMLHHQHMKDDCFDFLGGLLEVLYGHPAVRVISFEHAVEISKRNAIRDIENRSR